jgi:hypothetical protein
LALDGRRRTRLNRDIDRAAPNVCFRPKADIQGLCFSMLIE